MKRILLLGSLLAGAVAFSAVAIAEPEGAAPGAGRHHRLARAHRMEGRRLLKELALTDAQKACIKEGRTATESVRKDLREKIRAIREQMRAGERTKESRQAAREKVKEAVGAAIAAVQPQAQKILDSLTPDQKAVLQRAAAAHGRPTDDATLLKGVSRLLLRGGHRARAGK